ncbi:hypothetical protein [Candidatus Clostridium helianthi]|jgi:hypothetical protein|uniref:Uncharacterized protein n=1 Tax=Candidatus Clostridium helianthi TaxID=3381660 RepID=A0ABW8RZV5_9CLOT
MAIIKDNNKIIKKDSKKNTNIDLKSKIHKALEYLAKKIEESK